MGKARCEVLGSLQPAAFGLSDCLQEGNRSKFLWLSGDAERFMSCPQTAAVSCYCARTVTFLITQLQSNKINICPRPSQFCILFFLMAKF